MRKLFFVLVFIIIGLFYLLRWDKLIIEKFNFFTDIKISYINKIIGFSTTIEKYFNQASNIKKLREQNDELKKYKTLFIATKKQLNSLVEDNLSKMSVGTTPNIQLAKVLSYINFNDFTKVWLDQKKDDETILGLVTDEYAAGIVINENNRAVALLNGNQKCSYAVFIGDKKIPGIVTSSKDGKNLLIKYIPSWSEIKENDEVITSGMDNIFFEGLKVGKVTEISTYPDMKTALVTPYANVLEKKYFYTYRLPKKQNKEGIQIIKKLTNN